MWQYTMVGAVAGIYEPVDLDVAYFGYDGTATPKSDEAPPEAKPDPEALMDFDPADESVTAKSETNLRSVPSQGPESQVLYTLRKGQIARRIGISASGWSKVEFEGNIYYAVSSYLTTDLTDEPAATEAPGIQTQFQPVNEKVTAKDAVNLRSMPSTTHPDCRVVTQLKHGDIAVRTGINTDVGWSRVEYQGQILYCVSSYLEVTQ